MSQSRYYGAPVVPVLLLIAAVIAGCKMSAPGVVSTQPVNQSTSVQAAPAVITVTFDQPMATNTVERAITVTPSVGAQQPRYSWSNGNRTVAMTYPEGFQPDTTYTVRIGADAKANNNVTLSRPVEFSFSTGTTLATVAGTGAGAAEAPGTTVCVPVPQTTQPAQPTQPTQPAQTTPAQPALTFTKDIQPLAVNRCDGCHSGMATGKMSVYANAMKYVTANNPDNSPYYTRPIGNNHTNAWGDQADKVRDWINQGAKEE